MNKLKEITKFGSYFFLILGLGLILSLEQQCTIIGFSFITISFISAVLYMVFIIIEKKPLTGWEEDGSAASHQTQQIETEFISEVVDYALNLGVNAQIINQDGLLQLQAYTNEQTMDYICNMILPSGCKSPKDKDYKEAFAEIKENIDRYAAQKEEANNA